MAPLNQNHMYARFDPTEKIVTGCSNSVTGESQKSIEFGDATILLYKNLEIQKIDNTMASINQSLYMCASASLRKKVIGWSNKAYSKKHRILWCRDYYNTCAYKKSIGHVICGFSKSIWDFVMPQLLLIHIWGIYMTSVNAAIVIPFAILYL